MNILHINSYYNGSIFYKNLFEIQKNRGLNPEVFVPVPFKTPNLEIEKDNYVGVLRLYEKMDRFFFKNKQKKIYKGLIKNYNLSSYDLLHAHSLFTNGYIAMKIHEDFGKPYVVAVRNTDVNIFFKYSITLRKIGVQILNNASAIVFLSPSYKEKVIEKYIPKILKAKITNKSYIIPNGVDEFWFENKNKPKIITDSNKINVLFVGWINKNKNVITVAKALDLLQKQNVEVSLKVVGTIKDKNIFKKLLKYNFVSYEPHKNRSELLNLYRENDILIMPSKRETFGLVYVESMTQGTPIIYSEKQGFDNQFDNGTVGYSVSSKDHEEIAQKIKSIISIYENISKNCVKYSDKFKWNTINNSYIKIYNKIFSIIS